MALVRFSRNYPSMLDRFFDNDLLDNKNFSNGNTLPSVNIKEGNDSFTVEVAAPGLKKDDFKIELHQDLLTISSENKVENEKEEDYYACREFCYESFSRSFTLPTSADGEKISAKYEDGILRVIIPKKAEVLAKQQKKLIDIK
jgi:HSP20 family protein